VIDFDPKLYVTPRKSLKVMSREIQFGFAAARLALEDAGITTGTIDPERYGVVFGCDMIYTEGDEVAPAFRSCTTDGKFDFDRWGHNALSELYPLWLLKGLPNMPACHIAIVEDARGPNNSIVMSEASSLLALAEAVSVIERDWADVMIVGGTSCATHGMNWILRDPRHFTRRFDDPSRAMRPFDADRDGLLFGEGAAALVIESRQHAEKAGRKILARVVSHASTYGPPQDGMPSCEPIKRSIHQALERAKVQSGEIDHVNANGLSTQAGDRAEAQAIASTLGNVPVTAPKSFFGNLRAGTGALETTVSLLAFEHGLVPVTLNYERPDPECPLNVIHGEPLKSSKNYCLLLNQSTTGQAAAVVLGRP
jgi:3-oxoacyl-[acyl-carrier-protein] synthase II